MVCHIFFLSSQLIFLASVNPIDALREVREQGLPIPLQTLLLEFISYRSTDPRDKMYALLSLVNDGSNDAIDPNYTISPQTLFTRATSYLMQRDGGSLTLLHAAGIGYPRSISDLPSWVPDFNLTRGGGFISNLLTLSRYIASGDSHADISQSLDSDKLTFKGIITDRIRALSSMPKANEPYLPWINSIANMINSIHASTDGISNHEIFWRTIFADRTHNSKPATPEYARYFDSYVAIMKMNAIDTARQDPDPEILSQTCQEAWLFRMALNINLSGRQAFITHGNRAGLAPPETLEGDMVCIPLGATTPFLLRENLAKEGEGKDQCTYQLVGESYVHGIMEGEALALQLGRVQDIVLI